MTERPDESRSDEWDLLGLLAIVVRKWWVVVIVFAATVAVALFQDRKDEVVPPPVYEARTKLLIVASVSERILSQTEGAEKRVAGLSVKTLSSLATANDLLQVVITDLDLRVASGRPLPVENLAGMISTEAVTAGDGSDESGGVLTTLVRGDNPGLVTRIANKWAEAFVQRNTELVAFEAAGSYELSATQYESTEQELRAAQAERAAYQDVREAERLALKQSRARARLAREEETPLAPLDAELSVLSATYSDFLDQLDYKSAALVAAQAGLSQSTEALAAEDPVLVLRRAISSDVLWTLLADRTGASSADELQDLVLEDRERNELYYVLREENVTLRSQVSVLQAEIEYLEEQVDEQRPSIERLTAEVGQGRLDATQFDEETARLLSEFDRETGLRLSEFDQATGVFQSNLDRLVEGLQAAEIAKAERSGSIRVVEAAVEPSFPLPVSSSTTPSRALPVGAALGLIFGVAAAFVVHVTQVAVARRTGDGATGAGRGSV